MKDNNLLNNENVEQTPDVYMIPVCEEAKENSLLLATRIRNLGYICEVHYDANKIGSSIKKAVKKGAKYAMIIGDNEVKEGIVQLKNLANEEQISVALDDLEDKLDELFQEKEDDCCCGGHHHEDGECCHGHHHEEGGCCHHKDDEQK
jgi:histidyl-tRNA synthetase